AAEILNRTNGGMQVRTFQMLERRLDQGNQSTVLYPFELNNADAASLANLGRNLPRNGHQDGSQTLDSTRRVDQDPELTGELAENEVLEEEDAAKTQTENLITRA